VSGQDGHNTGISKLNYRVKLYVRQLNRKFDTSCCLLGLFNDNKLLCDWCWLQSPKRKDEWWLAGGTTTTSFYQTLFCIVHEAQHSIIHHSLVTTMPSNPGEETATVESNSSSNSSIIASPTEKKSDASRVKKRNVRGRGLRTSIKDLSLPEQEKARKFDLDGDGELDEAELAMMKYDVDGDGALTALEVHAIVEDLLRDRSSISAMRRIIAGLTCFVFILSLSNLGTSIASAILVKETTTDTATAEMKIVGTQASAETFEALEMDVDTRRARRAMVVQSLLEDPYGEHHHRLLAKGKIKCTGQKKCDHGDVSFDVNVMRQADVENIKTKCDQGRIVNIRRSFPGGSKDSKGLCMSGTSIVVKQ
jgi:hypothetical protein